MNRINGLILILTIATLSCNRPEQAQLAGLSNDTNPSVSDSLYCYRQSKSPSVFVMKVQPSDKVISTYKSTASENIPIKIQLAGACDMAIRNATHDKVCIFRGFDVIAYNFKTDKVIKSFGERKKANLKSCFQYLRPTNLTHQKGHMQFIEPSLLKTYTDKIPSVDSKLMDAAIKSKDTVWYDERTMTFAYQDSAGSPIGIRANRMGYDTGNHETNPDIHALVNYFDLGHFKAPFKVAAGTDFVKKKYALNFWLPPKSKNGSVIPVRWWKDNSNQNKRWRWAFPKGTIFGEVLFQQSPDGEWYVFEIRTRERFIDSWGIDVFRPFKNAAHMAKEIKSKRPKWQTSPQLKAMVEHLESKKGLKEYTYKGQAYSKIFKPINGALDWLPTLDDDSLIKEFLTTNTFSSVLGEVWKEDDNLQSYGPTVQSGFTIVPPKYFGGIIEVNDVSCKRCHQQGGRPFEQVNSKAGAYGEIWGEDEIFTWHLFDIDMDAYDVSDFSRRLNQNMVNAGLVTPNEAKPVAGTPEWQMWRPIKRVY